MAKADYEHAKRAFPNIDAATDDQWVNFFDSPHGFTVLGKLLGDAYGTAKDEEDRQAGTRRTGAGRRAPRRASLDEVLATVFPDRYAMDPFPEAMVILLAGRSQRAFAKRVPIHQMTLSRLMRGQYPPDVDMLERIAKAAKVHPAYFLEWRAQYIGAVLTNVMIQRPNLSVAAIQSLFDGKLAVGA